MIIEDFFSRTEVSQAVPLPAEPIEQKEVSKGKRILVCYSHPIIRLFLESEVSEKVPIVPYRTQISSLSKISNRTTINKINLTFELLRVRRYSFEKNNVLISLVDRH